jgi:hypothetical protein
MKRPVANPSQEKFFREWQKLYPSALPIKEHLNSLRFPNRWVRIHSLPLSKRYASDEAEWNSLLYRQNSVIDNLIPQGTSISFVINWVEEDNYIFKSFDPQSLGIIQEAEGEPAYNSYLLETTWESHSLNPLLIMIADDMMRAFIIAPNCLIGPYDGGMDVILKDPNACYAFKRRFKDWLSLRADGL